MRADRPGRRGGRRPGGQHRDRAALGFAPDRRAAFGLPRGRCRPGAARRLGGRPLRAAGRAAARRRRVAGHRPRHVRLARPRRPSRAAAGTDGAVAGGPWDPVRLPRRDRRRRSTATTSRCGTTARRTRRRRGRGGNHHRRVDGDERARRMEGAGHPLRPVRAAGHARHQPQQDGADRTRLRLRGVRAEHVRRGCRAGQQVGRGRRDAVQRGDRLRRPAADPRPVDRRRGALGRRHRALDLRLAVAGRLAPRGAAAARVQAASWSGPTRSATTR